MRLIEKFRSEIFVCFRIITAEAQRRRNNAFNFSERLPNFNEDSIDYN